MRPTECRGIPSCPIMAVIGLFQLGDNMEDSTPNPDRLLEGYRDLSAWGRMYAESYLLIDRVFMPVILGVPVVAFHYFENAPIQRTLVLAGGALLLLFWILRSKHAKIKRDGILWMLNRIEDELTFWGHHCVYIKTRKHRIFSTWLGDIWLKFWFFCIMLVVYVLLIVYSLSRLEC